jgi:HNH endonuclease
MKPQTPAFLDFRLSITPDLDIVLTAKARAEGLDKAAIAREILNRWSLTQIDFAEQLVIERERGKRHEALMSKKRAQISRRTRNAIFKRDGFKCGECAIEPGIDQLCIDHIVPVAAGGNSDPDNLRVLCRPCNTAKADKIIALGDVVAARKGGK